MKLGLEWTYIYNYGVGNNVGLNIKLRERDGGGCGNVRYLDRESINGLTVCGTYIWKFIVPGLISVEHT